MTKTERCRSFTQFSTSVRMRWSTFFFILPRLCTCAQGVQGGAHTLRHQKTRQNHKKTVLLRARRLCFRLRSELTCLRLWKGARGSS